MLGAIIAAILASLLIVGGVVAGAVMLYKEYTKLKKKDDELQATFESANKKVQDSMKSLSDKDTELKTVFDTENKKVQDSIKVLSDKDAELQKSLDDTAKNLSDKDTELRKRIIGIEDQQAALTTDFNAETITAGMGFFTDAVVMNSNPIVLGKATAEEIKSNDHPPNYSGVIGSMGGSTVVVGQNGGILASEKRLAMYWGADGEVHLNDTNIHGNLCIQDTCVTKAQLDKLLGTLKT